jgi:cobalt-zinc-cadmium efflux system outer membrane protein
MFLFTYGHGDRRRFRCSLHYLCAALLLSGYVSTVSAQESLTLTEATRRTLTHYPELQVFQWRFQALEAMRDTAQLTPAYELGFEAENIGGSGNFSGTDNMELTLSLSSVIELGGKRESRVAVADSRYALAQAEREAKALDSLGLVTQRFIATLTLQEKLAVSIEATQLAEQTYQLTSERVQRGAAPEAERLRAQAAVKQSRMRQAALAAELKSRKFALASLWKAEQHDFDTVSGDLFQLEEPAAFDVLYKRVAASPAITVYASEERLRDAEVSLARSQSTSNVQWSLGVRRFEDPGDSAFTAGVSVPLFSGRRNRGEVQSALAEREMVRYRRESALLDIRARLFEAWQTYQQSAAAARQIRNEVIPALEQALGQTRQAYERGRYSYVDWVSVQRELLDARLAAIDAASTALFNQALIEQLTAEPLAFDATTKPLQR